MTSEELEQLNSDCFETFVNFAAGARVYKWLKELCFAKKTSFVIGAPDASAFNEGHRDIIIEIEERIRRSQEPPPKQMDTINVAERKG